MVRCFLLHGGVFSWDGIVSSAGMNTLANQLRKIQYVSVETYLWASWSLAYYDIMASQNNKVCLIGYSGGGMKSSWIANGCIMRSGKIVYEKRPRIDLLVAYDPSPPASIQKLHDNVVKGICFHNNHPFMFGLGGGKLTGPNVDTIEISEQHLAVQFDQKLHNRTVAEVEKLL